jgi:hypothetical protein
MPTRDGAWFGRPTVDNEPWIAEIIKAAAEAELELAEARAAAAGGPLEMDDFLRALSKRAAADIKRSVRAATGNPY